MYNRKKADVILLCETWQSKSSLIPKLNGYSYVHKYSQHKLGGGVGIFVTDKLKYKERTDLYICQGFVSAGDALGREHPATPMSSFLTGNSGCK